MNSTESERLNCPFEEFIYCSGATTQVLKYGPWRDLWNTEDLNPPRLLFLIIPGNPGLIGYYRTFMEALYNGLNQQYPVWGLSHAGHCGPPSGMGMMIDAQETELEDVFGLNGQIEHKIAFCKKNVPKEVKLVLIGHSIGCYIILQMMKRASDLKVLRSVLLFPTIERMAQSPQGKVMTPVLCSLRYVLYMPIYLLSFLPESVKSSLVRFVLRGIKSVDEASLAASVDLFRVDCVANTMYMGSQEMVKVVDRDNPTIKQQLKKLIFYYGATDRWCPVQYYHDIRKDFPEGDIRLCDRGFRHAFVLDSSEEMASLVMNWLQEDLSS
ncbi:lipid droplet-associated hydrolase isoform X2 [Ambystoma mexicanum]